MRIKLKERASLFRGKLEITLLKLKVAQPVGLHGF